MKIFINPGHATNGIPDPGAVNKTYGLKEAVLVKKIGVLVEKYLHDACHETYLLQSDNLRNGYDDDLTQPCIVTEANRYGADLAVSIHLNAFNCVAHGCESVCFARGSEGEALADCIQQRLVNALGNTDRGVKYEEDKPKDKRLSFIMQTDMPAVIVEPGFIDNDAEAELIIYNIDKIARAIAFGITDYIGG